MNPCLPETGLATGPLFILLAIALVAGIAGFILLRRGRRAGVGALVVLTLALVGGVSFGGAQSATAASAQCGATGVAAPTTTATAEPGTSPTTDPTTTDPTTTNPTTAPTSTPTTVPTPVCTPAAAQTFAFTAPAQNVSGLSPLSIFTGTGSSMGQPTVYALDMQFVFQGTEAQQIAEHLGLTAPTGDSDPAIIAGTELPNLVAFLDQDQLPQQFAGHTPTAITVSTVGYEGTPVVRVSLGYSGDAGTEAAAQAQADELLVWKRALTESATARLSILGADTDCESSTDTLTLTATATPAAPCTPTAPQTTTFEVLPGQFPDWSNEQTGVTTGLLARNWYGDTISTSTVLRLEGESAAAFMTAVGLTAPAGGGVTSALLDDLTFTNGPVVMSLLPDYPEGTTVTGRLVWGHTNGIAVASVTYDAAIAVSTDAERARWYDGQFPLGTEITATFPVPGATCDGVTTQDSIVIHGVVGPTDSRPLTP